jgi:hypothetical protein
MLNHRALMQLHIEALYTHDAHGDLLRINEPRGAVAPRFFVGLTADGAVVRFRGDVDERTRQSLEHALRGLETGPSVLHQPLDAEPFRAALARSAPIENISTGPAFVCPDGIASSVEAVRITAHNAECLRPLLSPWLPDVGICEPMMALVVDGQAVAVCASVRITDRAHEAGVDTAIAFRGRGYALPVVAAWARAVRDDGVQPLYSTSWENVASQSVARKLGLVQFGNDLHIA